MEEPWFDDTLDDDNRTGTIYRCECGEWVFDAEYTTHWGGREIRPRY